MCTCTYVCMYVCMYGLVKPHHEYRISLILHESEVKYNIKECK